MNRIANRKPSGFTLIELLVVISIVSLLVAILLPALRSARVMAQATQSLAQVRTMHLALNLYAEDWKSFLPYGRGHTPTASSGTYWPGRIYHGGYQPNFDAFWGPGRTNRGLAQSNMKAAAGFHHWRYVGYSANYLGAMPEPTLAFIPSAAFDKTGLTGTLQLGANRNPSPQRHLLLAESFRPAVFAGITAVTSTTSPPDGISSLGVSNTDNAMYTHDGKLVRMYVDGHGNMNNGLDIGWIATGTRTGSWDTANFNSTKAPFFDMRRPEEWN